MKENKFLFFFVIFFFISLNSNSEIIVLSKCDDKELIIFMPGLGGDINNFRWIGNQLAKRGWPIAFIDHRGSNLKSFIEVLEGKEAIPGSADFFLYRIKDLDALLKAHGNGEFGLPNDS